MSNVMNQMSQRKKSNKMPQQDLTSFFSLVKLTL